MKQRCTEEMTIVRVILRTLYPASVQVYGVYLGQNCAAKTNRQSHHIYSCKYVPCLQPCYLLSETMNNWLKNDLLPNSFALHLLHLQVGKLTSLHHCCCCSSSPPPKIELCET